jgi:hypothetical protein
MDHTIKIQLSHVLAHLCISLLEMSLQPVQLSLNELDLSLLIEIMEHVIKRQPTPIFIVSQNFWLYISVGNN